MNYNHIGVSVLRGIKEKQYERKDPVAKLVRCLNQLHSVDRTYATAEEKKQLKEQVTIQIYAIKSAVPTELSSRIDLWVDNVAIWEADRDKIHL